MPRSVAFTTFIWLFTRKAPSAAPKIVVSSNGSACRITPMFPPCAM
jgi:hypothetical protein